MFIVLNVKDSFLVLVIDIENLNMTMIQQCKQLNNSL